MDRILLTEDDFETSDDATGNIYNVLSDAKIKQILEDQNTIKDNRVNLDLRAKEVLRLMDKNNLLQEELKSVKMFSNAQAKVIRQLNDKLEKCWEHIPELIKNQILKEN